MDKYELSIGENRTKISLLAYYIGNDLIVCIYNENAHIGAVAVGEYDHKEKRVSCSVITRLGHKDDIIAHLAVNAVSKCTKRPVCVIIGIHLNKITATEIDSILKNTKSLVSQLCSALDPEGA